MKIESNREKPERNEQQNIANSNYIDPAYQVFKNESLEKSFLRL